MRLWDYRLLEILPNKMLVAEWRECIAIKRQWEKGTLKHRLVSYVKNYDKLYFWTYVSLIANECIKRNININSKLFNELYIFCSIYNFDIVYNYYYPEHNERYLRECLYNLEEKATRGIISKDEWKKIYNKFKNFTELWDGE